MKIKLLLILLFWPLALRAVEAVALDGRKVDAPPKYLTTPRVDYPQQLIATFNYLMGSTVLLLDVDASGIITKATVASTSHPAFVAAALTAATQAKIAPAMIGGKPVASRWISAYTFQVKRNGGVAGEFPGLVARQPDSMPPEYACDVRPWVTYYCEPAFPRDLLVDGIKGKAEIQYVIDPTGRFESGTVLSASRPEFGAALLAAAESWTFLPAEKKGVKTRTLAVQSHKFLVGSLDRATEEERVVQELRKGGKNLVDASALDVRPRLIYSVAPKYPVALEKECVAGDAEVEVIVTRTGQAVLPRLVSATRPEFGWAALTAVSQWFFSVPRLHGQPVDVNVKIPFGFAPPAAPPAK